jgi:hypothetical protein
LFISADEGAEKSNFTWKFIHETLNKESGLHNGNFVVTYTPTADGVYTLDLTILNRKFATHMFTVSDSSRGQY